MQQSGFFIIQRESLVDLEPLAKLLYITLLSDANWQDKNFYGTTIKRGQLVTSRASLAEKLQIPPTTVRRLTSKLEKAALIRTTTNNQFTIVTIVNYEQTQTLNQAKKGKATNERPTNDQRLTNEPQKSTSESPTSGHNITTEQHNNKNNITNKDPAAAPPTPPPKTRFLDWVYLSDDEFKSLTGVYGDHILKYYLRSLDGYLEQNIHKRPDGPLKSAYKNHYKVILNWANRDKAEGKGPFSDSFQAKFGTLNGAKTPINLTNGKTQYEQ